MIVDIDHSPRAVVFLRLMEQNMGENMRSAVPGQQANALGQVRKGVAEQSGEEYKANEFKNERNQSPKTRLHPTNR